MKTSIMQYCIIFVTLTHGVTVFADIKSEFEKFGKATKTSTTHFYKKHLAKQGKEAAGDIKSEFEKFGKATKTSVTHFYNKHLSKKGKKGVDKFIDKAKSIWHGAKGTLKGMGQGFGIVTQDYYYNYVVINDAPKPVIAVEERLTSMMGPTFKGKIEKIIGLGPMSNSGKAFDKRQLYISIWVCADTSKKYLMKYADSSTEWAKYGAIAGTVAGLGTASMWGAAFGAAIGGLAGSEEIQHRLKQHKVFEKDIYPWKKNDDRTYFYRAYALENKLHVEDLGYKGWTTAFNGQFYNSTDQNIIFSFEKDKQQYDVTLDPYSFNYLTSSKKDHSIRPPADKKKGFQFYKGKKTKENAVAYIPITSQGVGNMVNTSKNPDKPNFEVKGSMLYTYKIYQFGDQFDVGLQGLSIGNFDQPKTHAYKVKQKKTIDYVGNTEDTQEKEEKIPQLRIRDLDPLRCHVWYQSADQAQKEAKQAEQQQKRKKMVMPHYFNVPETVWISYKTNDSNYLQQIKPGEIKDFKVIRPQIDEQEAWLYVVSLQTDDEKKVKKFLDRLHKGVIGTKAVYTNEKRPLKDLSAMRINPNGFIDDTKGKDSSGIIGSVLIADYFRSLGVGDGPFYYMLPASELEPEKFANAIWFDRKFYQQKSTGAQKLDKKVLDELKTKFPNWINTYQKDPKKVKDQLSLFLKEKGNKRIFVEPQASVASRRFTTQGKELRQTLLTGPISVKNYPIIRKAGKNYYVFTLGKTPDNWPGKKKSSKT